MKLTLGATPAAEKCAQVGTPNYKALALVECQRFIDQLTGLFPQYAEKLQICSQPHDFGTYYEVGIQCLNDDDFDAFFHIENGLPINWS